MCKFVETACYKIFFLTVNWCEMCFYNSHSLATSEVKITKSLTSLHISKPDHHFLQIPEICVNRAYGVHMLEISVHACTHTNTYIPTSNIRNSWHVSQIQFGRRLMFRINYINLILNLEILKLTRQGGKRIKVVWKLMLMEEIKCNSKPFSIMLHYFLGSCLLLRNGTQ